MFALDEPGVQDILKLFGECFDISEVTQIGGQFQLSNAKQRSREGLQRKDLTYYNVFDWVLFNTRKTTEGRIMFPGTIYIIHKALNYFSFLSSYTRGVLDGRVVLMLRVVDSVYSVRVCCHALCFLASGCSKGS